MSSNVKNPAPPQIPPNPSHLGGGPNMLKPIQISIENVKHVHNAKNVTPMFQCFHISLHLGFTASHFSQLVVLVFRILVTVRHHKFRYSGSTSIATRNLFFWTICGRLSYFPLAKRDLGGCRSAYTIVLPNFVENPCSHLAVTIFSFLPTLHSWGTKEEFFSK